MPGSLAACGLDNVFRKSMIKLMVKPETRKILNYQVIIYPDKTVGGNKPCFTAYCPILEIADGGKTIEEALENIKGLIKFHLECLRKERLTIPEGFSLGREEVITMAKVSVSV
jgi:predicted RNase H-like HicB family nuclease